MRVLICGGGVIGAATAYFLSCRGAKPIVVERTGVACAASGKSGGFLARDWCDGTPLQHLARRSFDLHAELADEIGDDWGYRRLTTFGGFVRDTRGAAPPDLAPWLSDRVTLTQALGSPESTAQVHPQKFTAALMRAAEANGAQVRFGTVTRVLRNPSGLRVTGIEVDGERLEGDAVVIAMGPWSQLARQWLDMPPVFGLKGHSLVFETGTAVPPQALFLECREAGGAVSSPEVFPRADGTTYVCAISSESPLPLDPSAVTHDPGAIERLRSISAAISPVLATSKVIAEQACFRPITRDGLPLIGRAPGSENAFIATGHSVWGILNAPATGEALAELIVGDQARTLDLSPFDPGRFAR